MGALQAYPGMSPLRASVSQCSVYDMPRCEWAESAPGFWTLRTLRTLRLLRPWYPGLARENPASALLQPCFSPGT